MKLPILFKKKRFLFLPFFAFFFLCVSAQATHIRAGNIFSKTDTTATKNPYRHFFKLVTYSVVGGIEDEQATLYFGDCSTPQTSNRAIRTLLHNGENNTWENTYFFEHTYGSEGTYTVSYVGENRNAGVVNLSNSVQQTFFITSTVTIDQFLGSNRSPVLLVPPIDVADVNTIFVHNPGAFDPDGDSLAYKISEPRIRSGTGACGNPTSVVAPGYQGLDNFLGIHSDAHPAYFRVDSTTGQITWNTPGRLGEYNIAFVVEEWRDQRLIGRVVRDMQIFVKDIPNKSPKLLVPQDICIVAGTTVQQLVKATDGESHRANITSYPGGIPGATFTKSSTEENSYVFSWPTECLAVRRQPYQVVFRGVDITPAGVQPLADIQPWRITVVGPAPVLTSVVKQSDNSVMVSWQAYTCATARKIYVYRKEGPSSFAPSACETGIPASAGFTKVAEVAANATSFLDTNNGQGLPADKTYYYRIFADFEEPAGGTSMASFEVGSNITGLSEELQRQFIFFPNPASASVDIKAPESVQIFQTEIYTMQGQRVQGLPSRKTNEGLTLDVKNLTAGLYIVKLETSKGQLVQRLVIAR